MKIDDFIILSYLNGQKSELYNDCWIYTAFGRGNIFETPDPTNREWVSKLYLKLKNQILSYVPRNEKMVKRLFPDFKKIANNYIIMLVVGFPDPYDAMVLEHNGKEYMIFDLIQFGADSLDEEYSCHRVLTHELIHMCLHKKYPNPSGLSYIEDLDYTAFDEGFAHALTFPEDINTFEFDDFLKGKYELSKTQLQSALIETDLIKQKQNSILADTGDYWDKFASISGKLFLLKHKEKLQELYSTGWDGFSKKIVSD